MRRIAVHTPSVEELNAKIEKGRDAGVVEAMVRGVIDDQMVQCYNQLINIYRQGNIDHDMIIGKIGEMAGLQNLLVGLENAQRQGLAALERTVNNG